MIDLIQDVQQLADIYFTAIKEIRIIYRDQKVITHVITPGKPISVPGSQHMQTYQQSFYDLVQKYQTTGQEVRVIFRDGAGASQFFPKGTAEAVVWASVIPKEELKA